jgi:hypothetical protein
MNKKLIKLESKLIKSFENNSVDIDDYKGGFLNFLDIFAGCNPGTLLMSLDRDSNYEKAIKEIASSIKKGRMKKPSLKILTKALQNIGMDEDNSIDTAKKILKKIKK